MRTVAEAMPTTRGAPVVAMTVEVSAEVPMRARMPMISPADLLNLTGRGLLRCR